MMKISVTIAAAFVFVMLVPGCTAPGPKYNDTEKNTILHSMLSRVGIPDSVVDVTSERVLVRYEVPENMSVVASWFVIMGAASAVAPEVPSILMQTYSNYEFSQELEINMTDALALLNDKMTIEEFFSKYNISIS